jgi:hypothetical protein
LSRSTGRTTRPDRDVRGAGAAGDVEVVERSRALGAVPVGERASAGCRGATAGCGGAAADRPGEVVAGCRGGAAEDPVLLAREVAAGTTRGSSKRKSRRRDDDGDGDVGRGAAS